MRFSYIEKIKANISITASKKTTHLLEGLYCSVFKGQSLDFDDLREYVVGDNYKDIDWKSSIRHGSLLVRRFIALRRHSILFLIDTGEKMSGETPSGEMKATVALYVVGTLGYLVNKNGDDIGAIYAKNNQVVFRNFKPTLAHLELILNDLEKCLDRPNAQDINALLEHVIERQKKRMIIVIVSDLGGLDKLDENVLEKVAFNHDLLFIGIEDANIADQSTEKTNKKNKFDLDAKTKIPKFITRNKEFAMQENNLKVKIVNKKTLLLKKYRMSVGLIGSKSTIPSKLIDLLERHNHAIRH